jgi:TolB-like protein/DNA-binding SARP family transcriptional activator/Tfp pilus assembly protein PilF
MASAITINILGPFEAFDARGNRLAVRSRRSRALFACLAMETGESWTRPRLATLLWDNRSEQQGRSSLRQELVQLRKDLGVTSPGDWGHDPFVCLPEQILTDVGLFRSAISSGDALQAASIWRGELLQATVLTAGPFADWLALSRSRLREAARECFARALRAMEEGHDPLRLEGVALKLIALDPGNEEAYRCLMRSSGARHDLAELIERYRLYAANVAEERGGEPSPAMKRLLDETIAAASRKGVSAQSGFSTRWIAQINRQHHTAAAPQPTRPLPIETATALAVIPFVDLSPGAVSKVALADGLTEETTTAMARIPGVFVTARQSSMVYKSATVDVRTIASDLGVRYLVEGSIEVRGKSVRVNARLIDGRSGFHIWANNYEEQLGEFFAVRNRIVLAVASQLQPALMMADLERALDAGPNNLDAWTRLQRANAHVLFNRSAQGLFSAIGELKQALAIDPDYAMAQSLLAAVYTWRATWSASTRVAGERALALEYAALARKTDPKNSFVLVNCADAAIYSAGNIDLALELLNEAVERSPYDPQGLALLANANRVAGADPADSLRMIARAIRISPRDPRSHRWFHYAGWCHWKLGELGKMEAAARTAIELYSDAPAQWVELTCALGLQGKNAEAKAAAQVLRKLSPTFTPDKFFEIAQQFYGKRFAGPVKSDYRALCSALQRAM